MLRIHIHDFVPMNSSRCVMLCLKITEKIKDTWQLSMPNLFLKEEWKKLQQKGPILLNRKWWGTRFKLALVQQIFTPNFSSITQKIVWLSFLWILVFTAWGIWPMLVFRSPIVLAYYKVSLNDHELLSSTSNYMK